MKTILTRVASAVVAVTLIAIGNQACAQDNRAERMKDEFQKRFKAADSNGDGKLSREEATKMPVVHKNFDAIDTAKTGFVTPADIATWARDRKAARSGS